VRDEVVKEALRRLAVEAATRLSSLVASGEELPFDVAENDGEHTFYRYVPLTARFIRAHADELRSLPAFAPACSAVDQAGAAAPYLEARGEQVPADGVERAEKMLVAFIARLWDGSTEFAIDKARLESALHELEVEARDISDENLLLAPLVGFQMPMAELELPGVRIVRADTVEVPLEATRSDGMHRNAWEPQYLGLAERDEGPGGSAPALRMLRELISVLRLFKEGAVGLGPHAYAPTGEGSWKRIATGASPARIGSYKLSEAEAEDLAGFARKLEVRPDPDGSLAWAVQRFELGCDRPTALDGLSDHLLAMRALFEGAGPVGANLPMRVAALVADPPERPESYEKLQGAFELERAMMAGEDYEIGSATGLAAWIEDATRAIVRGAALGEHGSDVAASADENLVATGLEAGEGSVEQMGEADEWEPPATDADAAAGDGQGEDETSEVAVPDPEAIRIISAKRRREMGAERGGHHPPAADESEQARITGREQLPGGASDLDDLSRAPSEQSTRAESGFEDGIYFEAAPKDVGDGDDHSGEAEEAEPDPEHDDEETTVSTSAQPDWLSEVSESGEETMEWPAPVRERSQEQADRRDETDEEPLEEPRVRHLFPVPDDSDWEVGELDYDRDETRVS
jgi:hypothetical protein